jgi:methionyl-tRNA synthetase
MSKSLGNVISPIELTKKYGADPLRLYFLKHFSPFSDGDFSEDKFRQAYNADLANGLGNLVARVARLCEKVEIESLEESKFSPSFVLGLKEFRFNDVLNEIWLNISKIDEEIEKAEPWKIKDLDNLKKLLEEWVAKINQIAYELKPFLPETAEKIEDQFKGPKIKSAPPLFPRI